MRTWLVWGMVFAICAMLVFPLTGYTECCSCEAPDGSCSVGICCPAGCGALCGNNGKCIAKCAQYFAILGALGQAITLDYQGELGGLLDLLQERTGLAIAIQNAPDETPVAMQFKEFPLFQLVHELQSFGTVELNGVALESLPRRGVLRLDDRVSMSIQEIPLSDVVGTLAYLMGSKIEFEPASPIPVNLSVQDMTVREVLDSLAAQVGAKWRIGN